MVQKAEYAKEWYLILKVQWEDWVCSGEAADINSSSTHCTNVTYCLLSLDLSLCWAFNGSTTTFTFGPKSCVPNYVIFPIMLVEYINSYLLVFYEYNFLCCIVGYWAYSFLPPFLKVFCSMYIFSTNIILLVTIFL